MSADGGAPAGSRVFADGALEGTVAIVTLGPALSGSVVTIDGALDNWTGPWPPAGLALEGQVPTEERRPVS